MRKVADILAKGLSALLYPLFIPTYGMMLFCYAFSLHQETLPLAWALIAIIGTHVLTCTIPLTAILLLIRRGRVSNLLIKDAGERTIPYAYTTISFCFWCYLLIGILHTPLYINMVAVGATIAIGIVTIINRRWKISAHLTAMGGLFGGFMAYCLGIGAIPTSWLLCLWMIITLLLMYARLWLNAHTPTQVVCGWLLGLTCTWVPYMIYYYVA